MSNNLDPAKKNSIVLTGRWCLSIGRRAVLGLLFASAGRALAQAPTAPFPAQITSAKTLFLANAGTIDNQYSTMAYNDLYQQLAAMPQYHLASSPQDADLALELSLNLEPGTVNNGSSFNVPYLRLVVRDVKTHTLLWAFTEAVGGALRQKTFEKNVGEAITKLAADLKNTASGTTTKP